MLGLWGLSAVLIAVGCWLGWRRWQELHADLQLLDDAGLSGSVSRWFALARLKKDSGERAPLIKAKNGPWADDTDGSPFVIAFGLPLGMAIGVGGLAMASILSMG